MTTKTTTPADIPVPPTASTTIEAAPDHVEGRPAEGLRSDSPEEAEFPTADHKSRKEN